MSGAKFASSYDYIICGGGTSGCVVAARLSEDPSFSVLLLEAGISDHDLPATEVPSVGDSLQGTDIDWKFKCEPQENAYKGYQDVDCSKAKILGGGSTHNNMEFTRCAAADYDEWAQLGCTEWGWKDVLPYYMKSENWNCSEVDRDVHQTGGPMTVSRPHQSADHNLTLSKAFVKAGCDLGYKEIDACSGDILGFGDFPANIDSDGKRSSTSRAYIHPAENRPNLKVLCKAYVTKIDIKECKAVGVYFVLEGEKHHISANREVIVAGGPISSPQLLMLSGIGPKKHLEEIGIGCIADLPVGKNLQDHLGIVMKVAVKPGSGVWKPETLPVDVNCTTSVGFVKVNAEDDNPFPDIQFIFLNLLPYGPDARNLRKPYQHIDYNTTREGFTVLPTLLKPKSVGEIKLVNSDPFCHPIIDPHYLEHDYDVKTMVKGIRLAKQMIESDAFKSYECQLREWNLPDSPYDPWSEDHLTECVRHFAYTGYHPVGTCKMGASDDPSAVVDPKLRVRGIECLRVVDSSIMPVVPSGNTNAPSVMIGEKGANIIKTTIPSMV
ncbi:4-pyridoxate dehydrogenase-like [Amphiura filiformis]|uniref:4-pyridoxate dehydrogenase-like n=1 Tax=Amphiura filiformis TaxID=82378 RepID=UPI003B223B22